MEIILYIFGVIGFTNIMVDSKVTQPIRDWFQEPYFPNVLSFLWLMVSRPINWLKVYVIQNVHQMINCYQCCGFWCGLFVGWATFYPATKLQILVAGFAGSFLANSAAIFMNFLEARTIASLNEKGTDD